jgi:hypothetical protein
MEAKIIHFDSESESLMKYKKTHRVLVTTKSRDNEYFSLELRKLRLNGEDEKFYFVIFELYYVNGIIVSMERGFGIRRDDIDSIIKQYEFVTGKKFTDEYKCLLTHTSNKFKSDEYGQYIRENIEKYSYQNQILINR